VQRGGLGKRRFFRLPVPLAVVARVPEGSGQEVLGSAQNISAGGLMADFPIEIPSGSLIRIILNTRRGPIEADCRVTWTAPTGGNIRHGLAFLETKERDFALNLYFEENR